MSEERVQPLRPLAPMARKRLLQPGGISQLLDLPGGIHDSGNSCASSSAGQRAPSRSVFAARRRPATAPAPARAPPAAILALKGDSYRLRGKDLDARPVPNHFENRLTDHPRSALPGPQTPSQRPDLEPRPPERGAHAASSPAPPASEPRHEGSTSDRRAWSTLQPTLTNRESHVVGAIVGSPIPRPGQVPILLLVMLAPPC